MGPGDEDEGDGRMTGVWRWGYGEGGEGAAFWGWLYVLKKPVHAWAKAVRVCKTTRVTDNRAVYRSVKSSGVYPVSAVHERRGGFSDPLRTLRWLGRVEGAKVWERTGADISFRDKARKSAIDGGRKAQRIEADADTAKVLKQKNGGL